MSDTSTPGPARAHTGIDPRSDVQVFENRTFPKQWQEAPMYSLPTDAKEHNRLDYQHEMIKHLLGDSIYPNPDVVKNALSLDADSTPNIVDIGTGSGVWAIEMAEQFPHANVLGCDIVLPNHPSDAVPSNCRFEFLDVNKDMNKLQPIFNVVHWRLVEPATSDSDHFFYDVARILRPGGVLIAIAANPRLVDETGAVIPLKPQGDPECVENPSKRRQVLIVSPITDIAIFNISTRESMTTYLPKAHPGWFIPSGIRSNPNFKELKVQEFLIPTGPWETELTDERRKLAEMMNENSLRAIRSRAVGLRSQGKWPLDEINALEEGSLKEYRELPPCMHAYSKWVFATAVRTDAPWSARTKPWEIPEGFGPEDHIIPPLAP
ncbi:hypothetical protein FRC04_003221 [Tulasnella sp. 424]|nr:hypothetical protein FRC04_003221 [Tulasnella sp. 424]